MMKLTIFLSITVTLFSISKITGTLAFSIKESSRRSFIQWTSSTITTATTAGVLLNNPAIASAASRDTMIEELETSIVKMKPIPDLLDQNEWDKVRTILKTPPINKLWNLGDSQNILLNLAKETGEVELLELKDELSISLQMCDQLTYDNAFVYFQPGNGKVNIKEPKQLANKAMGQIQDAINVLK